MDRILLALCAAGAIATLEADSDSEAIFCWDPFQDLLPD